MQAEKLYDEMKMDSLVQKVEAAAYSSFVAMPFSNRFGYSADTIYRDVLCKVVEELKAESTGLSKPFAKPLRADELSQNAGDISEEIAAAILNCHFFIADLTWANQGVLIECGMALAVKPSQSIFLMVQGGPEDLHFNIASNRVKFYSQLSAGEVIADLKKALLEGARYFENSLGSQLEAFRKTLTPQAVLLMQLYGRLQRGGRRPLHLKQVHHPLWFQYFGSDPHVRLTLYNLALQELMGKKLLALDYRPEEEQGDAIGLHATKFGACFLRKTWPKEFEGITSVWE